MQMAIFHEPNKLGYTNINVVYFIKENYICEVSSQYERVRYFGWYDVL